MHTTKRGVNWRKFAESIFEKDNEEIPEINRDKTLDKKVKLGEIFHGRYIDWASGASKEKEFVRTDCLPLDSNYANVNINPSEISNRAVSLEIQLDKKKLIMKV